MPTAYEPLLRGFLNGDITAPEFETDFLTAFKNDPNRYPPSVFDILDTLFAEVDDYVADPDLRREVGGLDDEQLRACARVAYRRLFPKP